MSKIDALAEGAGKLLSAVPDLYTDLAKPVVQETGKVLSFPIEVIQALLARPRCWIANANYKLQETNALIAKKLEKINSEDIKSPEDYIAVPALQALSYSMDSEELRNLYANLLAKSMYSDTSDSVHPSYVEIIKQLSPLDCKIFEYIASENKSLPIREIYVLNKANNSTIEFIDFFTPIDFAELDTVSSSLTNLIRLGLLQYGQTFFNKEAYNKIMENPNVEKRRADIQSILQEPVTQQIQYRNKSLIITSLGACFYKICCKDI